MPSFVDLFVGAAVVIAVIVFAGMYFWGQRVDKNPNMVPREMGTNL